MANPHDYVESHSLFGVWCLGTGCANVLLKQGCLCLNADFAACTWVCSMAVAQLGISAPLTANASAAIGQILVHSNDHAPAPLPTFVP